MKYGIVSSVKTMIAKTTLRHPWQLNVLILFMIAIVVFFACLYLRHGGNIEDMLIMMVLACPPLIQRIYPTQAGWFVCIGILSPLVFNTIGSEFVLLASGKDGISLSDHVFNMVLLATEFIVINAFSVPYKKSLDKWIVKFQFVFLFACFIFSIPFVGWEIYIYPSCEHEHDISFGASPFIKDNISFQISISEQEPDCEQNR